MTRFRYNSDTSAVAPSSFELTEVLGGAVGCADAADRPSFLSQLSDQRKRKCSNFVTGVTTTEDCTRDGDDSRSSRYGPDRKQNHSEIEKRRRDKMNTYITELSSMIPMCSAMARKLDKLTVLRMAVQHLKTVRRNLTDCPLTARPRPAFLSEQELNGLILQSASECFILVVGCDRGRLMYVSASIKDTLLYDQGDLIGQSLFDILHPKDVAKVKEQLASSDLSPRERLIDAKTMLPLKTDVMTGESKFCPGARRSFFCRMKCKRPSVIDSGTIKVECDSSCKGRKKQHTEKKYCVVQCTGYLKSWTPVDVGNGNNSESPDEIEQCNVSCLVAVGRLLPDLPLMPVTSSSLPLTRLPQFISRLTIDGKFSFVDQRVTIALGFLPQELLGTCLYEYISGPDLAVIARVHKTALLKRTPLVTPPYAFRRKDGRLARIQTHFKPFRNPWTKELESLVANNTILNDSPPQSDRCQSSFDLFMNETDLETQRLIDSQVESHKIGSAIAEEVLRLSPSEPPYDLTQDILEPISSQISPVENGLEVDMSNYNEIRNNVPLSTAAIISPHLQIHVPDVPEDDVTSPLSPPFSNPGAYGMGEAAMAVILNLLEADAGLGGPTDIFSLPWNLP